MNQIGQFCQVKSWVTRCQLLIVFIAMMGGQLSAWAQAPDSIAGTVMAYDLYAPFGGHRQSFYHRWFKTDGTFRDITSEDSFVPRAPAPYPPATGTWTYIKKNTDSADISFTTDGKTGGPEFYQLDFTSSRSGQITIMSRGELFAAYGFGKFTFRTAQTAPGPVNLSTRTFLSSSGATIAGFILSGSGSRFVLLRAVGPGLSAFDVSKPASGMALTVFSGATPIGAGIDWSGSAGTTAIYQNAFTMAGAFPLVPGLGDSCLLVELNPGNYTVQVASAVPGNALVEVYFLP